MSKSDRLLTSRLTEAHRKEVKGSEVPVVVIPKAEHVCGGCGTQIRRDKQYCAGCAATATHVNFRAGRKIAQQQEFLAKRSATQYRHRDAIRNWKPSDLPAWLTREVYLSEIVPKLATVPKSRIRSALGISEPYSIYILTGQRIPHPRHWKALVQLVEFR